MANYTCTDTELTSIANAIRTKGGTQAQLEYPTGFIAAINNIPSGGSDATATASDILSPKTAYVANGKVTGTITSKAAATIIPTTTDQTLASGQYLSGAQTIKGDANLVAANIANNVSIFGVTGTFTGGPSESDPVRFYDYDGTLLYSYTTTAFAALTEMPANPSHTGLVALGWNWTLADAKTQVTNAGACDIGQLYKTVSGATEIDVELTESTKQIKIAIGNDGSGGFVEIDWGDGSILAYVNAGSSGAHTYATAGSYTIKVKESGSTTYYSFGGTQYVPGIVSDGWSGATSSSALAHVAWSSTVKAIRMGEKCKGFGSYSLYYCYNLETIAINNIATLIVARSAYRLKGIVIPDSAISSMNTLSSAYNLRVLSCPKNYANISYSVQGNIGLKRLVTTATTINGTFSSNTTQFRNVEEVYLYDGTTVIASYMFNSNSFLKRVKLSSTITTINQYAFRYCYALEKLTLPNTVTAINNYAFDSCYGLREINIPSGVTQLTTNVFNNCYSLSEITLPNGLTSIGNYAFGNCYSLTTMTIPSSVTTLGNNIFNGCHGLREIHFKSTSPPSATSSTFSIGSYTRITLYVPTGYLSTYTSTSNYPSTSSTTFTYVEE